MPAFQIRIRCKCGHDFTAIVRPRGDDPPDKRYEAFCPMNGSRYTVRRRDLTCEVDAPQTGAIEARPERARPTADPWYTDSPWPAVIFAVGVLLAGLAALAGLGWLRSWW